MSFGQSKIDPKDLANFGQAKTGCLYAEGGAYFMLEDLLQPRHLLVVLLVALFVFGPKKLPELGKGLAEGIRNFKNALKPGADAGQG
ncbi:MAG TPA: twin-arginine translocase TatA/TatE family subunit [Bryobacteraceae bacterium]